MRNTILTIGSHSSLQILHGARKEGFRTVAIVPKGRKFYRDFWFIDEVQFYSNEDEAVDLINGNTDGTLIPHGSLVEYIGAERVKRIRIPIFGNRNLFEWEADQHKKMTLLEESRIRTPKKYRLGEEVDKTVIVKLPGAKGGRGYFLSNSSEEIRARLDRLVEEGTLRRQVDAIIQEFVVGVPMYFQLFRSKVLGRTEISGIDIRYESNIDGLRRYPANIEPTFTVTGNIPVVARESLLTKVFDYADNFSNTVDKIVPPGLIGPYCLESVVTDNLDIVVFEFSGRIVAGTNLYVNGSPYSWLYWDQPMSVGRRIAREIKIAEKEGRLNEVVSG